jgi:hypothetical protein
MGRLWRSGTVVCLAEVLGAGLDGGLCMLRLKEIADGQAKHPESADVQKISPRDDSTSSSRFQKQST